MRKTRSRATSRAGTWCTAGSGCSTATGRRTSRPARRATPSRSRRCACAHSPRGSPSAPPASNWCATMRSRPVGRAPVKDAVVLIRNGHIEAVARVNEIPVPRGAQVVSLIGKTIIPGLIDAHAHVERWAVERYLAWGVTTVRDLGAATTDSSIALQNDLDLGSVRGPRMFTSGAMIDGVPATYRTATAVRTREQVRKAVDQRAVAGADLVKIYTKFSADLLPPLLDEASTLRLPIAAHLGKIDALTAARAGVASL